MDDTSFRTRIGSYLVIGSTIALTVLAAIMVTAAAFGKGEVKEVVQTTFSSLLPMFGTWVGTVLAFYFSKENFEAANRGTIDMVKAVGQRLGSIPVVQKMIPASQVISLRLAPNQAMGTVKISDVEALFAKSISGKKISRLLVLDSSGACVAVVHRSLYMEAFASALRATPAVDPAVDTIAKLLAIGYPSPPPVTYEDFFTARSRTSPAIALWRTRRARWRQSRGAKTSWSRLWAQTTSRCWDGFRTSTSAEPRWRDRPARACG
jgi:hypothetical protein